MSANPSACGNDTVVVSGCSDPIPRLLYAKITNVSGCSQFDGKVVQILHNSASGVWKSDDPDLLIQLGITGSSRSLSTLCFGDFILYSKTLFGDCTTPIDDTWGNVSWECCGTVDIHIGEVPP